MKTFIKQPLKGITVTDSAVGTRTPNILMGEHAGEYVRGDMLDANATYQSFEEWYNTVQEAHHMDVDALAENMQTQLDEKASKEDIEKLTNQISTKVEQSAYAAKMADLERRLTVLEAALEAKQAA